MCFGGPTTTTTSTNTGAYNQQQYGTNTQSSTQAQTGKTQQTQQSQTQQQQSTTPTLPSWLTGFYQSIPQQYQSLLAQTGGLASRPLYGPAQQANFENQLNSQTNAANKTIQSQLAATGALNSTRAAQADTALQLGKIAQNANYQSQIPLLNAQFQQGVLGQQGNLLSAAGAYRPPVIGQTTSGTSSTQAISDLLSQLLAQSSGGGSQAQTSSGTQSSGGTQTQQQSGGFLNSLMGGLLGAGLSALTGGASSLFGGGGGGSNNPPYSPPFSEQNYPPNIAPTSYGATLPSSTQMLGQLYGNVQGPNVGPYNPFPPTYPTWG